MDDIATKILRARSLDGIPRKGPLVPFRNIGELLETQTARHRGKPWLIFYPEATDTPAVYTYDEFTGLVRRTAAMLLRNGIRAGDRIATVAYNHADTVIQYFGAWMMGAVVVPINVGEDDRRITFILGNSQAKLAFVRTEFLGRMKRIREHSPGLFTLVSVGDRESPGQDPPGDDVVDFHSGISAEQAGIPDLPPVAHGDEALLVYTSGTTGLPKGVVLTHQNLLIDARSIAEWHGMTGEQRMMCVLPIHHVNGTVVTLMTPLYYGGSVVLNQKFHSQQFFKRIRREHVQVVSVVPTLLQFLLHEHAEKPPCELTDFRHIICGAGPLTCELALRFEELFGIPVIHGYGLSETTCYSCFLPVDLDGAEHRRWMNDYGFPSIGVPLPCNEMAIHNESGEKLPDGTKGEIVIRGANVMKEYYANPDANEQAFLHGWFRSGDEGFSARDALGRPFFFITGRIKELIIRGGVNISPFEIDEVLMNIPGVKAGLAVGFENDWYGEEVGAYVVLKQGASLPAEQIMARCRECFSYQKAPKIVVFGTEIPVTSTGKYQRNKLKPLFAPWKKVQFSESETPGGPADSA